MEQMWSPDMTNLIDRKQAVAMLAMPQIQTLTRIAKSLAVREDGAGGAGRLSSDKKMLWSFRGSCTEILIFIFLFLSKIHIRQEFGQESMVKV